MRHHEEKSETAWKKMFRENAKHLELSPDCADSWVKWARLIMLDDYPEARGHSGPEPLDEAEKCILKALELESKHLEALEEAAHFYDVMVPNRAKAVRYAKRYLRVAGPISSGMQAIIDNSN